MARGSTAGRARGIRPSPSSRRAACRGPPSPWSRRCPRRPLDRPRHRSAVRRARVRDRPRRRPRRVRLGARLGRDRVARRDRRSGAMLGETWHPFRDRPHDARARRVLRHRRRHSCAPVAARRRVPRRAQRRRQTAEQDERTRIARELHDVLAHSLCQITVQSGVGLHLFDREPERAREALAHIRSLSAPASTRCAACSAFLRDDGEAPLAPPKPQLAELPRSSRACARPGSRWSSTTGSTAPCRASAVQSPPTASRRRRSRTSSATPAPPRAIVTVERAAATTSCSRSTTTARASPGRVEGAASAACASAPTLLGGALDARPRRRAAAPRVTARLPWGASS